LFSDGQIAAITPNIGPTAALRIRDRQGPLVTLSAAGSIDPDGTVETYGWDFGDGTRSTTTEPVVTHRYARAGAHTVTVTVTDDEGCSTRLIYTGTTATCTGGDRATARLTFR
jgi:6-phosphogluconolactonase